MRAVERAEHFQGVLLAQQVLEEVARLARLAEITLVETELQTQVVAVALLLFRLAQRHYLEVVALALSFFGMLAHSAEQAEP
jgi:hypothetical protein